jgi:hypothetical protein
VFLSVADAQKRLYTPGLMSVTQSLHTASEGHTQTEIKLEILIWYLNTYNIQVGWVVCYLMIRYHLQNIFSIECDGRMIKSGRKIN